MGRLSQAIAVINMTSNERKKYVYGLNKDIYFSHFNIDEEFLKKNRPIKKWNLFLTKTIGSVSTLIS